MTLSRVETLDEQIARLTAERDAQPVAAAVASLKPAAAPAAAGGPLSRPELPLFALAALALVGSVVLAVTGHAVPDFLQAVTLATLTGGAGAMTPRAATAAAPTATVAVSSS